MRGIAPVIIVAIIAIGALVGWGLYLQFGLVEESSYERLFRDLELVNVENTLYIIREDLSQALLYSFYQAFFEVFSNSGFENSQNGISFWRDYNKVNTPPIVENINSKTLQYFNEYKEEIRDKSGLELPPSEKVSFNLAENLLVINATSNGFITTSGDVQVKIPDVELGTKVFSSNFYSDFLFFSNYLSDEISKKDKLKKIFYEANESTKRKSECNVISIERCENENPNIPQVPQECLDLFKNYVHDYLDDWNKNLRKHLPKTLKFSLEIKNERTDSRLSLISSTDLGESKDCGCKVLENGECKEYYHKYEEKYDIEYLGYAKLLFKVSKASSIPLKDALPVFSSNDGKNVKRFPQLMFYIRSGTLRAS